MGIQMQLKTLLGENVGMKRLQLHQPEIQCISATQMQQDQQQALQLLHVGVCLDMKCTMICD